MAGNKNSGRKTRHEIAKMRILSEKAVDWGIKNFDLLTDADKIKILTSLATKFIPQKLDVDVLEDRVIRIYKFDIEERLEDYGTTPRLD